VTVLLYLVTWSPCWISAEDKNGIGLDTCAEEVTSDSIARQALQWTRARQQNKRATGYLEEEMWTDTAEGRWRRWHKTELDVICSLCFTGMTSHESSESKALKQSELAQKNRKTS